MEKETLKNILDFLEEKEDKRSFLWKILNNEPLTEEELNFYGNLNLTTSKIESLPEGLKVDGNLSLYGSKNIQSLPEGLKVGGDLDLDESAIESLPEGLKVDGDLEMQNTTIQSLPKGLKLLGSLYIKNTPLAKFSDESLKDMIGLNGYIKGRIVR